MNCCFILTRLYLLRQARAERAMVILPPVYAYQTFRLRARGGELVGSRQVKTDDGGRAAVSIKKDSSTADQLASEILSVAVVLDFHETRTVNHAADVIAAVVVEDGVIVCQCRHVIALGEVRKAIRADVDVPGRLVGVPIGRWISRCEGARVSRIHIAEVGRVDIDLSGGNDL